MSAIAALRALAAGRPLPDSILGACRLESGNIDAFGSEAIGDAFRRVPLAEVSLAEGAECATAALLLTHDEALFADIYDGRIGRLWRIGQRGGICQHQHGRVHHQRGEWRNGQHCCRRHLQPHRKSSRQPELPRRTTSHRNRCHRRDAANPLARQPRQPSRLRCTVLGGD